jgi:hypothetical protein
MAENQVDYRPHIVRNMEAAVECVAIIAVSAAVIFAKFAQIQELNPFLWGTLALVVYAGAPAFMIWRGASVFDAPIVWLSSFGGLAALFIAQSIVADRARRKRRSSR